MTSKSHPMLFAQALARAVAAGTKTVTRRPAHLFERGGDPTIAVGDTIWVRETWRPAKDIVAGCMTTIVYAAGGSPRDVLAPSDASPVASTTSWKPSIHMPRFASRSLLLVSDVSFERLGPLDEDEARREGFESPIEFRNLWDAQYREAGLHAGSRPRVVVIRFELISG